MEKITTALWRPKATGKQQEDTFWWNTKDKWVYISRAGGEPKKLYPGAWIKQELVGRENFRAESSRHILEFLKVRLPDETEYDHVWRD